MNFTGKICPYCKTEFKEDDDVIICSDCEMPHHKECWTENKACTTFGCAGTIMGTNNFIGDDNLIVNNNLVVTNNFMNTNNDKSRFFCTKCGAAYIDGKAICNSCGNVLLYDGNNNYNSYNSGIMDADMETFVGKNQNYYVKIFQKLYSYNSKISWNWASAFFPGYWYGYRKIYKIQFLYYVMFILIRIMFNSGIESMLNIIAFVISGVFGNYLYKNHAEEHVQIAKNMDDNMKQSYLIENGGIRNGMIWIIFVFRIIVEIIFRTSKIR